MKWRGSEKSRRHANKRDRRRSSQDRQLKTRQPARFWSFVTVVGAKSRTLRLSARRSGCSQSSEHGRYPSPISMWRPQRKSTPVEVSIFGSHRGGSHRRTKTCPSDTAVLRLDLTTPL